MWVIVVHDDIQERRNNLISNIIGIDPAEKYLNRISGNVKYSVSYNLSGAIIYKTESGAIKIVEEFNNTDILNKANYSNKYNWIKDRSLSLRKLSKEEYFRTIDLKIEIKKSKFNKMISKMEKEKMSYK